ncbi:MAG TPA: peptidylprolyl isomerase [Devosia sp.]|nr:peptidylprolyl isomerase [Devosia sp.]
MSAAVSASINGQAIAALDDEPIELAAVRELLRQRAVATGLLAEDETDEVAVTEAIEALLTHEVETPEPTEAEIRRYYDGHLSEFRAKDLVNARHILFQVTSAVNVPQIRERAESTLNILLREPERFEALARELSNCPSGEQGGILGQLGRGDTVPEFEKALFKPGAKGVQRDVVKTRFGFHIIAVDQYIAGDLLPFDLARDRVSVQLRARVEQQALRQYVSLLAGSASIDGVDLVAASTPLVQ